MNVSGNHLRQNILTEQWIIYSSSRSKRPNQYKKKSNTEIKKLPEKDSLCPFCPGNEKMLPEIIYELKTGENNQWFTRTVTNKYPVLTVDNDIKGSNEGIYLTTSASGKHEVIIESPYHNHDIPVMSNEQVTSILKTYSQRYRFLFENYTEILHIIIFRNHGPTSGTSLIHPHSQIVGISIIPTYIHDRDVIAKKYFEENKVCLLCKVIEIEKHYDKRVVLENTSFIAFVPFAAEVPFEVWIVPKRHCSVYADITEYEIEHLANLLKNILIKYNNKLNNPDYNYVIYSSSKTKKSAPYLHWYLQIKPRTTIQAGFEIGSGINVNPSLPENDAEILKLTT